MMSSPARDCEWLLTDLFSHLHLSHRIEFRLTMCCSELMLIDISPLASYQPPPRSTNPISLRTRVKITNDLVCFPMQTTYDARYAIPWRKTVLSQQRTSPAPLLLAISRALLPIWRWHDPNIKNPAVTGVGGSLLVLASRGWPCLCLRSTPLQEMGKNGRAWGI